jgi:TIR domain
MAKIFVNYRSDDEPFAAALVDRELSQRFGSSQVFSASGSIRPTQDFEFELLANIRRSHVLTAVVGARWLTATHETGGLRLTDGNDWVRREIVEAFSHGVRVVPVLVGNVAHLRPRELPGALARCQYLRLRHRDIVPDLCRLKAVVALLLS